MLVVLPAAEALRRHYEGQKNQHEYGRAIEGKISLGDRNPQHVGNQTVATALWVTIHFTSRRCTIRRSYFFSGNTVFQSFFMSTTAQPWL